MIKGEIVVNYYFGRVFFAYAIGSDKRHGSRGRVQARKSLGSKFILFGITISLFAGIPLLVLYVLSLIVPHIPNIDTF